MPTCFKYLSFEAQSKQIQYNFSRFCWGLSSSATSFRLKYIKMTVYNANKTHQNSATLSVSICNTQYSRHSVHINSSHTLCFCSVASAFKVCSYLLFPPLLMLCGTENELTQTTLKPLQLWQKKQVLWVTSAFSE